MVFSDDKLLESIFLISGMQETEDALAKRKKVIQYLNVIVGVFCSSLLQQEGISAEVAQHAGGLVLPFGSFKLDAHEPGSDIDAVCLAPNHVTRESFFRYFPPLVQELPEVSNLTVLSEAYVPLIKLTLSSIEVDLLFVRLQLPSIPPAGYPRLDVNHPLIFRSASHDVKGVMSLNGCRVASALLRLVPNKSRFRMTLRLVKRWARARGIYGNVLGYLGGINCAIMVAKICQEHPNVHSLELLRLFFSKYASWNWPEPVMLDRITQYPPSQPPNEARLRRECGLGPLNNPPAFRVWSDADDDSVMPLITPVYPSINSARNVSQCSLTRIKEEFRRGTKVLSSLPTICADQLIRLILPVPFVFMYTAFVVLEFRDHSDTPHAKRIRGIIETRLRSLVESLGETNGFECVLYPFAIIECPRVDGSCSCGVNHSPNHGQSLFSVIRAGGSTSFFMTRESAAKDNHAIHTYNYIAGLRSQTETEACASLGPAAVRNLGKWLRLHDHHPPQFDFQVEFKTREELSLNPKFSELIKMMHASCTIDETLSCAR